jgi:hypothetical protein
MSSFSFAIARRSRPMPARDATTDTTATLRSCFISLRTLAS